MSRRGLTAAALGAVITMSLTGGAAVAADAPRVATPPMGWNSWYQYGKAIDEELIREQADAMVASGMRDAGYEYLIVDGGWRARTRDAAGDMQVDPEKFPSGMKALADYVHSKGLEFGLHQPVDEDDCGNETPGTGSAPDATFAEKARRDATLFASWGIDFLKFDWCGEPEGRPAGMSLREWKEVTYGAMGDALDATGRDIVYSISEYGRHEPWEWAPGMADMWRTTKDIAHCWACPDPPRPGITAVIDQNAGLFPYGGAGLGFNDPDQLQIGIDTRLEGQQPVPQEPLPIVEQRSHFSMWAMLAAPLIASPDMRDMSSATREILLNEEVIAIDQDPAGVQGRRIRDSGDEEVWARPLADGSVAVALFNRAEAGATMAVGAGELGFPEADAYVMRDVWAHRTTAAADTVSAFVPSHGTALFTVRPGEPSEAEPATVLAIDGGEELVAGERGAITTTVTNLGRVAIQDVTQTLDVPPGWEIEPAAGPQPVELAPRRSASVAWHVRPPAGVDPGRTQELTAAARFRQGEAWTSTESQVHVLVDPFREYVPHSEMTATASSVFGDGATPDLAIDGDPATFWHSAGVARDPLPATVTLDLGRLRGVKGLTYLPRQDGQDNGHITRFAVSVSTDGSAYTEVASGEWAGDAKLKASDWPATAARYVRLEAVDGVDGVASAAEVDVAADGGP